MNPVKLYTCHGLMWIDTEQLNGARTNLTIYTARGNKLCDVAKTQTLRDQAAFGVHRENLFASQELADANRERILDDIFKRRHG